MIQIYSKSAKEKKVNILENPLPNVWINVENPTEEEMIKLTEEYQLDTSIIRDATDIHEVPRIEVEDKIVYIFTRFVYTDKEQYKTTPLLVIYRKNFIITITTTPFPRLHLFLEGKVSFNTKRRRALLLKILGQVNVTYTNYLNNLNKKLYSLTFHVEKISNKDIVQFISYENVLYELNSALVRIHTNFTTLHAGKIINFEEDEKDYVEDLMLESIQLIQITKENLRTIVNIREAYSTIITNNLNQVIKLFTSLTVILTLPTIIASLYGMNVNLPFANSPFAFAGIVIVIAAIMIAILFVFSRKNWL